MSDDAPVWHALKNNQVLDDIGSDNRGLSGSTAQERLEQFGPNALPGAKRRPVLLRFFSQFHNLFIYVLLAAGVIAAPWITGSTPS
jgi:magnesium-transporting ATPase (P-type)